MTFNQIKLALYATYLTNYYGYRLKSINDPSIKKILRIEYANKLLKKIGLRVKVINPEKIPADGQYLLVSNHRSVIDPLVVDIALSESKLLGDWIAKKELYNSFFFGLFVRNAGTILLDRSSAEIGMFMRDIKETVKEGSSIYIFPEGTRNKSDKPLSGFKDGSRIIALKNRLDILPVYIKSNTNNMLMDSLTQKLEENTIEVEFGDLIHYKDKSMSLEDLYKKEFNIK